MLIICLCLSVQHLSAAGFSAGLQYFGQSLHGVLDINGDGLVDLAVGALGAAVIIWSDHLIQPHMHKLTRKRLFFLSHASKLVP